MQCNTLPTRRVTEWGAHLKLWDLSFLQFQLWMQVLYKRSSPWLSHGVVQTDLGAHGHHQVPLALLLHKWHTIRGLITAQRSHRQVPLTLLLHKWHTIWGLITAQCSHCQVTLALHLHKWHTIRSLITSQRGHHQVTLALHLHKWTHD